MQHLTRWRTVTAAATTAALAAGAFGIANAVSASTEQPSASELGTDASVDGLAVVDDENEGLDSTDSEVSATTVSASQPSPTSPPSPASVDSPAEASRSTGTERPVATTPRVPSADSPSSPDSPPSPDSPSSPSSPSSVDSVSSVSS